MDTSRYLCYTKVRIPTSDITRYRANCLTTASIEATTCGMLALQCCTNWATQSSRFKNVILRN